MRTCMLSLALGAALIIAWPPSTATAQKRGASARLQWKGVGEDKVQQGRAVRSDGKPDGQFRLLLKTDHQRRIVHVLLRSCDKRGVLTGRVAWDTDRTRLWVLGVFKRNRALTLGRGKTVDTVKGRARYSLFASKPLGGFKPGTSYCAYVTFGDGMGVSARANITEPVRAGLSFSGKNRDRVGRNRRAFPDGVLDAHFVLRMDSGNRKVELRSLSLFRVDRRGRPVAGQRWDTNKTRNWLLGVERGRNRLNKRDRPIRDKFGGMAEYHLYVTPRGRLKGGERFKVVARFATGGPAVALVKLPRIQQAKVIKKTAAPPRPLQLALRYRGFTADKVGRRAQAGPDGKRDAQFTFTVNSGGQRINVTKLELSVSDAKGNTWRKTWDTKPGGNWILGVERGGRRLNPTDRAISDRAAGRLVYTLWASADSYRYRGRTYSYFTKGGYFTARVYVDGRLAAIKTIRLYK